MFNTLDIMHQLLFFLPLQDHTFRFPPHGYRFFTDALNDVLPSAVIQHFSASWQLTADSFYLLTVFLTTPADPSHSFRMTPFVLHHYDASRPPLLVTSFPPIVILNGGKNTIWKSRETGWWNRVKNLLPWMTSYRLSSPRQQILCIRLG